MTAIVGVLCNDGVVIGIDSSSTFGHTSGPTIQQLTEKLVLIGEGIVLAGTGAVGMNQRFTEIVNKALTEKKFNDNRNNVGKHLCASMVQDFKSTGIPIGHHNFGALLAFSCHGQPQLCEFEYKDFQPEFKTEKMWFASMGATQPITDPFLGFIRKVYWNDGPPKLNDGIFAVAWTLEQAVELNTGGVRGPIRIAVLEKKGISLDYKARILEEDELDEHRQNIAGAEEVLRQHRQKQAESTDAEELPSPPKRN